ncbi:c-type cytochrome [Ottowia thiooxydans]|uniref:c-type cytochrome n=1 Tax=Ottowia thiooxydans TaxID=219182 RepID=UPI00040C4AF4|nr:cytochrome c [Ottowia thiooxydans]
MNSVTRKILLGATLVVMLALGWLWHVNYNDGIDVSAAGEQKIEGDPTALRERGAYLARAGNCMACHTTRASAPWAGGRTIATPFGTLYSSNLTPDPDTGIGQWNAAAFWRALHNGRSRDGRLLYPAFPYTHTTQLVRADSDALYTFLKSLPPVRSAVPDHQLSWPFGTQAALAVWRALYFQPGSYREEQARGEQWNRGAYLVRGVAHCSACHTPRDGLAGADWQDFSGGLIPAQGWYAPSLVSDREAGVGKWPVEDIVQLLRTGYARGASTSGPMAEVVSQSTQYLSSEDLTAMAIYLKSLPQTNADSPQPGLANRQSSSRTIAGQKIYDERCASCHGSQGEGIAGAYPPLAGNRAVTLPRTENLLQMLLYGGFGASTSGHPRPFGMPPFVLSMSDAEMASVLSYIRNSWGNQAPEVSVLDVHTMRAESRSTLD